LEATLSWGGAAAARQVRPVLEISRGGVGLENGPAFAAGTEVTLDIPGVTKPIPARIARTVGVLFGLSFRQDADSLALIDQALKVVEGRAKLIAA
jgi:hypothetical protein